MMDIDGNQIVKFAEKYQCYEVLNTLKKDERLSTITQLDLSGKNISQIPSCLKYFTNLKYLNLGDNQIWVMENLECLVHLTYLNIWRNSIHQIQCLQNLTQLTDLNLFRNQITSLSIINNSLSFLNFSYLKQLNLGSNKIESTQGILYLVIPNIRIIGLLNNKIISIRTLRRMWVPHIQQMNIRMNKIISHNELNELKAPNFKIICIDQRFQISKTLKYTYKIQSNIIEKQKLKY